MAYLLDILHSPLFLFYSTLSQEKYSIVLSTICSFKV